MLSQRHLGARLLEFMLGDNKQAWLEQRLADLITLTPILFAEQVRVIGAFNTMNERNIAYRVNSLNVSAINREVRRANKHFAMIGSRASSLVVLMLSALASLGIDYLFRRWGMFSSWNNTNLANDV